ncbi:hypothetical protein [Azospirillum argentinense]|uniref:Uncharacterized protein n=1 Tax=Azospirillum argentinense TaxID=2970906 RepID=A0A5B0KMJ3_9PROT|nr:hypothetical protein [Azospirillum argentinense]KAA1053897.1 hypothetical protein FH063_002479 [Azospirillum argentinense]
MKKWSYVIVDDQENPLSLTEVLTSEALRLSLIRRFDKGNAVSSRAVTHFDVSDYPGAALRNVECFHLCVRVMGHDGAIQTALSLLNILTTLHETSIKDPASALATLREGDIKTILAVSDARLRSTITAAAA